MRKLKTLLISVLTGTSMAFVPLTVATAADVSGQQLDFNHSRVVDQNKVDGGSDVLDPAVVGDFALYDSVVTADAERIDAKVTFLGGPGLQDQNCDDKLVKLDDKPGSDISTRDPYLAPDFDVNLDCSGGLTEGYGDIKVEFFLNGTSTPVVLENLKINLYDLDNAQFAEFSGVESYSRSSNSIVNVSSSSEGAYRFFESNDVNTSSSDGTAYTKGRVEVNFRDTSSLTFRLGATVSGAASFELDFSTGRSWSDDFGSTQLAPISGLPTSPPYTGPVITDIGEDNIAAPYQTFGGQTVRVDGERLSSVTKVFIDGKEGILVSTADDHFVMISPDGLTAGTYDLVVQSGIGNLSYKDGFVVTDASANFAAASAACEGVEPSWWTQRISDTEAKAYIKCPAVGQKYRILHQTGGSGSYDSIFAKTLTDENDTTQVFNEFGRYIVRTIDLEDINRIRIRVDDEELWKVRYNNPPTGVVTY